jgi:hypothetical protein
MASGEANTTEYRPFFIPATMKYIYAHNAHTHMPQLFTLADQEYKMRRYIETISDTLLFHCYIINYAHSHIDLCTHTIYCVSCHFRFLEDGSRSDSLLLQLGHLTLHQTS